MTVLVRNYTLAAPEDAVTGLLAEAGAFTLNAQDISRLIDQPVRAVVTTLNRLADAGRAERFVRGTAAGPDGGWTGLPAVWRVRTPISDVVDYLARPS